MWLSGFLNDMAYSRVFRTLHKTLVLEIYLLYGRHHYYPYHLVHSHYHQTIRGKYYLGNTGSTCTIIFPKDISRLNNEFQKYSCNILLSSEYSISTAINKFSSQVSWPTCISQIVLHRLWIPKPRFNSRENNKKFCGVENVTWEGLALNISCYPYQSPTLAGW
jgi:hypothetical protein